MYRPDETLYEINVTKKKKQNPLIFFDTFSYIIVYCTHLIAVLKHDRFMNAFGNYYHPKNEKFKIPDYNFTCPFARV